jgi:putative flippase GtrA
MVFILKLKEYLFKAKGQLLKFFAVGLSSTLIDLLLLIFFKESLKLSPVLAVATSQLLVITYNFLLNKYWSFAASNRTVKQFSRYLILVIFNYLASITLMYLLYELAGFDYKLVRLFSIAVLFLTNFLVYKHWVYKE